MDLHKAGVPQGSILGPLLFLIYINDIVNNINSDILLFADDTSLLHTITDPIQSIQEVNQDLETLRIWAEDSLVTFNPTKTKYMIFSKRSQKTKYDDVHMGNIALDKVSVHKQLGITFTDDLTWENHITDICTRASSRIDMIKRLPSAITPVTKLHIYTSFIRPILEYGSVLFDGCTEALSAKIEHTQRQALLAITRAYRHTSQQKLLLELGLKPLSDRRETSKLLLVFKMKNSLTPKYLSNLLPSESGIGKSIQTRQANTIKMPASNNKTYFLKSFLPSSIQLWNNLPRKLITLNELDKFKNELAKIYKPPTIQKAILSSGTEGHINLLRLRLGLSGLNSHRKHYHFINHSTCSYCQATKEDPIHYLTSCTGHAAHRGDMIAQLRLLLPQCNLLFTNLNTKKLQKELCQFMLHGKGVHETDVEVFNIVAVFIDKTQRFKYIL